jgi:hypothetical protein
LNKTIALIGIICVFIWTSTLTLLNFDWLVINWGILLILLNLYLSSPLLSTFKEKNSNKLIGALPSINVVVFFGSVISILITFLYSFGFFNQKFHLILQILTVGSTSVLSLFLVLSGQLAGHSAQDLFTREDLLKFIDNFNVIHQDKINNSDLQEEINGLKNYIQYKMPHPSSTDRIEYINFSENLKKLSENTNIDEKTSINHINELLIQAKIL